jgi:hypothetical protein
VFVFRFRRGWTTRHRQPRIRSKTVRRTAATHVSDHVRHGPTCSHRRDTASQLRPPSRGPPAPALTRTLTSTGAARSSRPIRPLRARVYTCGDERRHSIRFVAPLHVAAGRMDNPLLPPPRRVCVVYTATTGGPHRCVADYWQAAPLDTGNGRVAFTVRRERQCGAQHAWDCGTKVRGALRPGSVVERSRRRA